MHKKIILLNIVLILCAICLSYFGFKTAKYQETEIMEDIRRQAVSAGKVASGVVGEIFEDIEKEIDEIPSIMDGEKTPDPDKMLFAFDSNLNTIYPRFKTYRKELKKPNFSLDFLRRFQQIETLEVKGDLKEAIISYEALLKETRPLNEKALAQFAIARALKKKGDKKKALFAYKGLKYFENFSPDGLNLNIISRYEIIKLNKEMDDFEHAISNALSLLHDIQNRKLDISEGERTYFANLLFKIIDDPALRKSEAEQDEFAKLKKTIQQEKEFYKKTALLKNIFEWLESKKVMETEHKNISARKLGDTLLFFKVIENKKHGKIIVSTVKDKIDIDNRLIKELKIKGLFGDIVCWVVSANSDAILQTGEINTLSPTVALNLGEWLAGAKLNVYHKRTKNIEESSRRRMAVNISMVGILFIIIILSSILSLRMTMKEVELSRMKTNFISSVSHEMRLPLSTIKTANEMFNIGKIKDNKQAKKYYEYIASEVNRLERLVSNVLDFSRIDAGRKKYHFKKESLGEIAKEAVGSVNDYFKKERFSIEENIEGIINVRVDKEAVMQAVLNLLDNAKKYSGTSKIIKVKISRNDKYAVLDIIDKGIGIEKDKISKVFDVFYRTEDEMTRKTKGVGLGLSIVKHIMDVHRGKVEVKSEKGEGSTFSLLFPLDKEIKDA